MKKLSFIFLLFGLIFSQIVIIKYNLNNGFEYQGLWFKLLPIADYSGKISEQTFLTSTILGYFFFIGFGVLNTNKIKSPETFKSFLLFTGIALVVSFFEFTSIIEDLNSNFQGKHFRIGWLLFLLGLWLFSKRYLSRK